MHTIFHPHDLQHWPPMLYTTGWNTVRTHSTNTDVFSAGFLICSSGPQELPFKRVVIYNHKGSKFLTKPNMALWGFIV